MLKRCTSLLLTVVMLLGMLPTAALAAEEDRRASAQNPFAGKTVSILSASTSTYDGVSNNTSDNSTIGNNAVYYTEGRHGVYLKDTWWQQVIDALDMQLLVNNSWSGSCVFQPRRGAASVGYGDRAVNLHNDHTGEEPDIIWVYLGCNDFAYYKDTFGKAADVEYSALIRDHGDGTFTYAAPRTACEAYAIMLHKVQTRYPDAEIYCFTSVARRDPDYAEDGREDTGQPTEYNAELMEVAEYFGYPVIDWENCIPKEAELFDKYIGDKRAHPNADGMDLMSQAAISGMLGRETTLYDVSGTYTGADTDNPAAAAIEGMAYQAELTPDRGYSDLDVTVTMDGVDVTRSVYADGAIHIETVTGDIEITAVAYREPKEFRWEVVDDQLVSTGEDQNALTVLSGTITDGVITGGKYRFAVPVVLKHDRPWVMEWKCGGDWRGPLLSTTLTSGTNGRCYLARTKGGQLCFGTRNGNQSNNYGADLSALDSRPHTYRLENRIADDGSNMVWLYLDGAEIGAMNHYFIASEDQGTTANWLSGRDFVMPYIGLDTTPLDNWALEYLQIWEGGDAQGTLTHAVPASEGVANAVKRAYQLTDVTWTPLLDMPGVTSKNGVCSYQEFEAGKTYTGIPYSGVIDTDTYVGLNVSLDSFLTALQNENSVLYTKNLFSESYPKKATYFGTVCSKFAQYALNVPGAFNTANVPNIPGMDTIAMPGKYDLNDMELGDVIVDTAEHTALCTDILYNAEGDAVQVEISEAVLPTARRLMWTASEFAEKFADYRLCRYAYIDDVPAIAEVRMEAEPALMPRFGDKYNYRVSNTAGVVDILKSGYSKAVILRDGAIVDEIALDGFAKTFTFSRSVPGEIEMYLETATGARSESVYACVVDSSVGVADSASFWNGELTVNCTGTHGTPLYVQLGSGQSVFCALDGESEAMVTFNPSAVSGGRVRVAYENEYGIYLSPWTAFTIDENSGTGANPSRDTMLSQGVYWDGWTLTPSSAKPVIQEGKEGYWTYAMVPVEGNATYYSKGANRSWYFDSNKQPISTINVYKDCTPAYQFTTPANAAYMSLTYSTALVEQGTESMRRVAGEAELILRYDDRYDVTGKTVEIIDAGKPTSYQVGYGVAENAVRDTAVVTLKGDTLVAAGIGTAQVKIDGEAYTVVVESAPISLLLLAGQSNMRGSEGDEKQSIVCPDGMVYATYGDDRGASNTAMTEANAHLFAPSALAGNYSTVNVAGTTECLSGYPVNSLTEAGVGKIGPDSGFAYEWVQQTGEKVWVVNAAHGGTSISVWQENTTEYEQCKALFTACQETLRKEIAAGHYTLSHMAYFWCQGCSDRGKTAEWYVDKYLAMHDAFKSELAFDHDSDPTTADKTFEFGGIIPVRVGSTAASYRDGVNSDKDTYSYHESFVDLRMSGPRVAQYWMGNNPELEDIWNVCTIGEDWVWMPDGTNGVADYFRKHYPGGTVDYTTQVAQKASWYTPTTPKAVHDSIHYNQIGYNELGRESVRNALIMLGELEDYNEATTVEFVNWTGYQPVNSISASTTGQSGTLVVPMVSPITRCKDVTYAVSDGLTYKYYDLLAKSGETTGTLTAVGANAASVNVVKQQPGLLYADHLSRLPQQLCCGLNLWSVLEHDPLFYSSGTHWGTHSSGTVYSVTIPVQPGDKVYATAFGKAGENGHATTNGIRCTFFGEYDVVKTLDPAGTYAEFRANGGYLVAPEGATAINIPMWTNDDSNEIYILNRTHDRTGELCSICGKSSHEHSWSAWKPVSLPTAAAQGVEQRTCTCGETQERKVDGVWQKYALADHLSQLPANTCCDTNLWAVLEHDKKYFASGTNWAVYSGGDVCSVTIPVTAGERIYASSWGKAGQNGHASSNGIRTTFFDAYGIAKTMDPATTYAEFKANGGYLVAPEGAVAVNVAMWTGSNAWELYLLDRDHRYVSGVCTGCGAKDPIAHSYTKSVTQPTVTQQGYTTYTCTACGDSYKSDYVPATGKVSLANGLLTIEGSGLVSGFDFGAEELASVTALDVSLGLDFAEGVLESLTALETIHGYPNSDAGAYARANGLELKIKTLRVLLIGNSHTMNYSSHLTKILKDMAKAGMETTITIDTATTGSIGLYSGRNSNANATYRSHLEGLNMNSGAYTKLSGKEYDLIVVQDYLESMIDTPEAFAAGLSTFLTRVEEIVAKNGHGTPQIAWFADWVDVRNTGGDSAVRDHTGASIKLDKLSREEVYAKSLASIAAVERAIAQGAAHMPDFVIQGSTIKQNAMSSYLGSTKNYDNPKYCLLESDTTHLTELGCYVLGVGVLASIADFYGSSLTAGGENVDVSAALSLANRPSSGMDAATLAVVREAAGNFGSFVPSAYTVDPITLAEKTILETKWNLAGAVDAATAADAIGNVIREKLGAVTALSVKVNEFTDPETFRAVVTLTMGYSKKDIAAEAFSHKHSYTTAVTQPTCTERGYTTYTCACGDSYVGDYVAAKGHSWDGGKVTTQPTCTKEGVKTYTCKHDASHTKTEAVAKVNHTAGTAARENEVAASCTKAGSYDSVVYCTACKTELSRVKQTVSVTAHKDANGDYICDSCQTKLCTSHVPVTVPGTAATCEKAGLTDGSKCGKCGVVLTAQQSIPAKGHSWDNGKVTTQPTCTKEGVKTYTCKNDASHTKTEAVAKVNHTAGTAVRENEVAATCTKAGSYDSVVYCTACKTELSRVKQTVSVTAHKDVNGDYVCDVCQTKLCTSHSPVTVPGTAATCEKAGLTDGSKCGKCGVVLTAQQSIPAKGHSWDNGKVTTQPTCTKEGVKTYTCKNDASHTKTETVAKLSHTAGSAWKYDSSRHWHECTVCSTKLDTAAHKGGPAATATTPQTCKVCGYVLAPATGGEEEDEGGAGGGGGGGGGGMILAPDEVDEEIIVGKDGSVQIIKTQGDGTNGTTDIAPNGVGKADIALTSPTVNRAQRDGEAVELPMAALVATADPNATSVVTIKVPGSFRNKDIRVELRVKSATAGTVAVLVHEDGTETVIPTTAQVNGGLAVTIRGNTTLKLLDKSVNFIDVVPGSTFDSYIDFVSARGLFNGTTANTFEPNVRTSRGQVMTVLARLAGADTSGAAIQKGMAWAVEQGISDGSNPGGAITRQQLATMLWRYAGEPKSGYVLSGHTDAYQISDYATTAMAWCLENGILTGYADGTLKPQNNATRAHVAAMIARYVNHMGG